MVTVSTMITSFILIFCNLCPLPYTVSFHESRAPFSEDENILLQGQACDYVCRLSPAAISCLFVRLKLLSDFANCICRRHGRPFLADPFWVRKAAEGRADEINTCIGCNQACLDHTFKAKVNECECVRKAYSSRCHAGQNVFHRALWENATIVEKCGRCSPISTGRYADVSCGVRLHRNINLIQRSQKDLHFS